MNIEGKDLNLLDKIVKGTGTRLMARFSLRSAGNQKKSVPRKDFIKQNFPLVNKQPLKVIRAEAVHGSKVEVVSHSNGEIIKGADGVIYFGEDSLGTAVTGADCCPVLVYSEHHPIIGAIHCGRNPIRKGVIENCLSIIKAREIPLKYVKIILGPVISQKWYRFDRAYEEFPNDLDCIADLPYHNGKGDISPHLDIKGLIVKRFLTGGVSSDNIDTSLSLCTHSTLTGDGKHAFFSFRRDGVSDPNSGPPASIGIIARVKT